LQAILDAGFEVPLVLTQPDRPAGRGQKFHASPVKQLALERGFVVHQPERLKDPATHQAIIAAAPDILVIAAYGLILPQAVLDIPPSAASTSTPRCCRAGAAPHPSCAPSRPATPKPA
jgi:methionyl-tRNA formyltransferase